MYCTLFAFFFAQWRRVYAVQCYFFLYFVYFTPVALLFVTSVILFILSLYLSMVFFLFCHLECAHRFYFCDGNEQQLLSMIKKESEKTVSCVGLNKIKTNPIHNNGRDDIRETTTIMIHKINKFLNWMKALNFARDYQQKCITL